MTANKRERFARAADRRMNRAINALRLIGELSNRSKYSFTEEAVERIFSALYSELREAHTAFGDLSLGSDSDQAPSDY